MSHSVRLLELFYLFFFAAFVAVACGGVHVCTAGVYGHITAKLRMRDIETRHRRICLAAEMDSLQLGDYKALHGRNPPKKQLKEVYRALALQLHPDRNHGRIPDDIASKQFACITVAYSRMLALLKERRESPYTIAMCERERGRGDRPPSDSAFYRTFCMD